MQSIFLNEEKEINIAVLCKYCVTLICVLMITLALNVTILLNAPIQFLTSKWEVMVAPLSILLAIGFFMGLRQLYQRFFSKRTL